MVYDATHRRFIVFGGMGNDPLNPLLGDTWEYDLANNVWTETTPDPSPPSRMQHVMVFDSSRGLVIMHGGSSTFSCGDYPPCAYSGGPRAVIDLAYAPATPCVSKDATARAQLLADSIVAPGAVFDYPSTKVDFLFGLMDCTESIAGGLYYASKITSEYSVQYLVDTSHAVFMSDAGAAAIESAINTDCVVRH